MAAQNLPDIQEPVPASEPAPQAPRGNSALVALFARIGRSAEKIIIPINDAALDDTNHSPAFYCVHSLSGAGGTDFNHLAKLMPETRFYGIQAPPTKVQEESFGDSVPDLADYYADALAKFQPKGPFLLGGWSAGAIIGLEIAQNLRKRGRVVRLFVAIDAAPENSSASLPGWHPIYWFDVARNLPGWILRDIVTNKRSLRSLVQVAIDKVAARYRKPAPTTGGPKAQGVEAIQGIIDVARYAPYERSFMSRLYAALLAYEPRKYAGHVVAYEATAKPLLNLPQVGRVWSTLAPTADIVAVKGTHLSILRPGDVNPLAEDLRKRIAALSIPAHDEIAFASPAAEPAPVEELEPLEKKTA